MKPIDKKDMPKLIALIAVAVIAFGYGVFTFMSGSSAKPPAPAASPSPKPGEVGGAALASVNDGTWHPDAIVILPTSGRDPFMPDGATAPKATPSPAPPATPAPESTPLPLPRPGSSSGPGMGNFVPPLRVVGIPGKGGAPRFVPTPRPTPVPAPVPDLDVSGVLVAEDSERSVVIIKDKDEKKGNRFLSIGDAAGNGWRVSGIKERTLVITDPKTGRRKTVEMKP